MHAHKDMCVINPRPKVLEIVPHGITNLLRKWQPALTATFADNADTTLCPVDIGQKKVSNIACAQAQSGQQQDDRAVARARGAVWITGPKESLYIGGVDITRQGDKSPRGDARNRPDEVRRTIPVCGEKAQEHPYGIHRRLRPCLTMSTRYGKDNVSHLAGAVGAGIVTQRGQKLLYQWRLNAQRAFCHATVLAHPVIKSLGQRGDAHRLDDSWRDRTSCSQVTEKASCPGPMVGVTTFKTMPTQTGGRMARKGVDEVVIDVVDAPLRKGLFSLLDRVQMFVKPMT
jgi:hypothetical protein